MDRKGRPCLQLGWEALYQTASSLRRRERPTLSLCVSVRSTVLARASRTVVDRGCAAESCDLLRARKGLQLCARSPQACVCSCAR